MESYLTPNNNIQASAFISCSLRPEDKPFIEFVERILVAHNILPFGTVGRYAAAPENPAFSMRNNIAQADMVVIVATRRYFQLDMKTGLQSNGLSEMIHAESGMAFAFNKPVLVFVQEGTDVGCFLPNITQYITLTGDQNDLNEKWHIINSLLYNSTAIVQANRAQKNNSELGNVVKIGLALIGAGTLLNSLQER